MVKTIKQELYAGSWLTRWFKGIFPVFESYDFSPEELSSRMDKIARRLQEGLRKNYGTFSDNLIVPKGQLVDYVEMENRKGTIRVEIKHSLPSLKGIDICEIKRFGAITLEVMVDDDLSWRECGNIKRIARYALRESYRPLDARLEMMEQQLK